MIVINKLELEKQFKKLKQLDRIEFRQRENRIRDSFWFDRGSIVSLLSLFVILAMFSFSLAFLGAPHYGDSWFYAFYNLSSILTMVFFVFLSAMLITKLIWTRIASQNYISLLKEYFPKKVMECKK